MGAKQVDDDEDRVAEYFINDIISIIELCRGELSDETCYYLKTELLRQHKESKISTTILACYHLRMRSTEKLFLRSYVKIACQILKNMSE